MGVRYDKLLGWNVQPKNAQLNSYTPATETCSQLKFQTEQVQIKQMFNNTVKAQSATVHQDSCWQIAIINSESATKSRAAQNL